MFDDLPHNTRPGVQPTMAENKKRGKTLQSKKKTGKILFTQISARVKIIEVDVVVGQ